MPAGSLARFADGLDRVNRAVGLSVRWFAVLMVVLQFAIVILRYVFGISDIAATEAVLYLHAALFMLGAGYTLMVDGHVRVDIFYARRSTHTKAVIDLLGHIVLLWPAMVGLLVWSWPSVRNSWAILEGPISVGGIPAAFLLKTLIPLFCVLLLVQSLALVLRQIVRLSAPR